MSFLERKLAECIKNLKEVYDTLFPSHPREMIKDSSKESIRMFNSNIINGAKSGIINRRMGLPKQGYIYKTIIQIY